MQFTIQPTDFAPVGNGLLYGFETGSDEPKNVQISVIDADTDAVIGRKSVRRVKYGTIDIAPYVSRFADFVEPVRIKGSALVEAPCCRYVVEADGVCSRVLTLAGNGIEVGAKTSLTTMTRFRKIALGERDEVRLFGEKGSTFNVTLRTSGGDEIPLNHTSATGAVILFIDTADFAAGTRTAEVAIRCDGRDVPSLCYTVVERYGADLRLAWLSMAGTVERYTFPVVRSMTRNAVHRRVERADGIRRTVECTTEQTLRLVSAYEPHAVAEAIAEIASSPRVWLEGKAVDSEVEVLSSSTTLYEFGRPDCVEVDLRVGGEEVLQ